jgi:hypothetical protein
MSEPGELRHLVADEYGLDHEATRFLRGSTLAELEASAAALAKLLGERDREPAAGAPDLFTAAAVAKAERQRALLAALTGRAPQPRDVRGRWTGFDGGARQPLATKPPEDHGAWLVRLIRTRAADAGAAF